MPDLADLYPGFASKWIDSAAGRIFARTGGEGPPLLLLHGYPQTNVMWHRLAPALAQHFSLVIPDLPGYGWSDAPRSDAEHAPYTKRAMAAAMIEVMEALGHVRLRSPAMTAAAASAIASRSIIPVASTVWPCSTSCRPGRCGTAWMRASPIRAWHWPFLALPEPFPETMIGKDPLFFFDWRAARGTKARSLAAFDPRALAHYHAFFNDPVRIHATCEDYRAGRTTDLAHDEADRACGKKITCPMLALWGAAGGIPAETEGPLATWREWATDLHGFAIDCGHYLAEEAPEETAGALIEFFTA